MQGAISTSFTRKGPEGSARRAHARKLKEGRKKEETKKSNLDLHKSVVRFQGSEKVLEKDNAFKKTIITVTVPQNWDPLRSTDIEIIPIPEEITEPKKII